MKVKELINLLQQVDPELPVFTEYDTWCCVDDLEAIIVLESTNFRYNNGIYLTGTDVEFIVDDQTSGYKVKVLNA